MKVCIAGGAGFIGSHLAKRLKREGNYVIIADIKEPEYFSSNELCDEFYLVDLKSLDNCLTVTKDCKWVFNMAAVMGGMGCIQSNNAVILYANTMISFNILEACRRNKVKRYFFSSSACIYPEYAQLNYDNPGLKESDAWPAAPQDAYGLEKLCTEELCMHYERDFGLEIRIGRFHNIYGPYGTWNGGKEKAPAAFGRKALVATDYIEMWGNGNQTRSFCYIDDCIDGILLLMNSSYNKPLNIGSDEIITINQLAHLALSIVNKENIEIKHIHGPIGVNGRNSDNTLIRKLLGWNPKTPIQEGLRITINWIKKQLEKEANLDKYAISHIIKLDPDVYCGK